MHPRAAEQQADLATERLHLGRMTAGLQRIAVASGRAPSALGWNGRGIVLQKNGFHAGRDSVRARRIAHANARDPGRPS